MVGHACPFPCHAELQNNILETMLYPGGRMIRAKIDRGVNLTRRLGQHSTYRLTLHAEHK